MFFTDNSLLDLMARGLILGPLVLLWVILVVQIIGLRTFSKMTSFDFVATIATGSLLATAASADSWTAVFQPSLALLAILAGQSALAILRRKSDSVQQAISNNPVLLMRDGEFYREVMIRKRVTETDIWSKLREANVLSLTEVRAVVLETTGDISVLHGKQLDAVILTGVECKNT